MSAAHLRFRSLGLGLIDGQQPRGEHGHRRVVVLLQHPLEDFLPLCMVVGLVEPLQIIISRPGARPSLGSSSFRSVRSNLAGYTAEETCPYVTSIDPQSA